MESLRTSRGYRLCSHKFVEQILEASRPKWFRKQIRQVIGSSDMHNRDKSSLYEFSYVMHLKLEVLGTPRDFGMTGKKDSTFVVTVNGGGWLRIHKHSREYHKEQ